MPWINCPQCGRLTDVTEDGELLCRSCETAGNSPYKRVRDYVYHHRGATIQEVEEATGVSKHLILQYLKEGRLSLLENKSLLNACQGCGRIIDRGKFCGLCLEKDLNKPKNEKKVKQTEALKKFGSRTRR